MSNKFFYSLVIVQFVLIAIQVISTYHSHKINQEIIAKTKIDIDISNKKFKFDVLQNELEEKIKESALLDNAMEKYSSFLDKIEPICNDPSEVKKIPGEIDFVLQKDMEMLFAAHSATLTFWPQIKNTLNELINKLDVLKSKKPRCPKITLDEFKEYSEKISQAEKKEIEELRNKISSLFDR